MGKLGTASRFILLLGLALTAANLLHMTRQRKVLSAEELCAGRQTGAGLETTLAYMNSVSASDACRVCVAEARDFQAAREKEALAAYTTGMVLISGGESQLGSPEGEGDPDEHPAHKVILDAFYLDSTEVTAGRYLRFVEATGGGHPEWLRPGGRFNVKTGSNPYYKRLSSILNNPVYPVIGVQWSDADAYCRWAGKRLPTEAEWETAARGGSALRYHFGADGAAMAEYGWTEENSGGRPHPVALKTPNAFGLYDMSGNLWEWTADYYSSDYYSPALVRNPKGPETGRERVLRGGSWSIDSDSARPGNRASHSDANDDIGFRCALSYEEARSAMLPAR